MSRVKLTRITAKMLRLSLGLGLGSDIRIMVNDRVVDLVIMVII